MICVGQLVRVTKNKLKPCFPVLDPDSWKEEVTEGVVSSVKRLEGNAIRFELEIPGQSPASFVYSISPVGPLFNHHGQRIEILKDAPRQERLIR